MPCAVYWHKHAEPKTLNSNQMRLYSGLMMASELAEAPLPTIHQHLSQSCGVLPYYPAMNNLQVVTRPIDCIKSRLSLHDYHNRYSRQMFLTKYRHFCLPDFGRVAHPSGSMFQHARPEGCRHRPEQGLQSCLALLQRTPFSHTDAKYYHGICRCKTSTDLGSRNVSCNRSASCIPDDTRVCNKRRALLTATWRKNPMQRVPAVAFDLPPEYVAAASSKSLS